MSGFFCPRLFGGRRFYWVTFFSSCVNKLQSHPHYHVILKCPASLVTSWGWNITEPLFSINKLQSHAILTCPASLVGDCLEVEGSTKSNSPFSITSSVSFSLSSARFKMISSTVFLPIRRITFTGLRYKKVKTNVHLSHSKIEILK